MTNKNNEIISNFLQTFNDSVTKALEKNLDGDIYTNINFSFNSTIQPPLIEDLKENKVIYKTDFAIGEKQGNAAILIPEELIANIADSITGGKGEKAYKGSISEIEMNSVLNIFKELFKTLEDKFKSAYEKELIFSSNPKILLKETEEYIINSPEEQPFNFVVENTLILNEEQEYKFETLLNKEAFEKILSYLGITKSNSTSKINKLSNIDLSCLSDIKINITAELGRTRVPIKYALELIRGSLIELDTQNNADIKVFANDVEFAYAQVVAVGDSFGLKITKIISPEERLNCL